MVRSRGRGKTNPPPIRTRRRDYDSLEEFTELEQDVDANLLLPRRSDNANRRMDELQIGTRDQNSNASRVEMRNEDSIRRANERDHHNNGIRQRTGSVGRGLRQYPCFQSRHFNERQEMQVDQTNLNSSESRYDPLRGGLVRCLKRGQGRGKGITNRDDSNRNSTLLQESPNVHDRGESPSTEDEVEMQVMQIDANRSSQRTKHGTNKGTSQPKDPSQKIFHSSTSFAPKGVVSEISATVRYHLKGPWSSWLDYPQKLKRFLWEEFKKKYTWKEGTTNEIYSRWWEVAHDRFRDMLCKERRNAKLKANSKDPKDWIGYGPDWIGENFWKKLCQGPWNDAKFKRLSESGQKNRMSSEDGTPSTHTGGSRPFAAYEEDMDKYSNLVGESNDSSLSSSLKFNPSAWIEACGGISKGRVYGFGTEDPHEILGDLAVRHGAKAKQREALNSLREESDERYGHFLKEIQELKASNKQLKEQNSVIMGALDQHMPEAIRKMLQEVAWTNHTHAGGSGAREQEYLDGIEGDRGTHCSDVNKGDRNKGDRNKNGSQMNTTDDDDSVNHLYDQDDEQDDESESE